MTAMEGSAAALLLRHVRGANATVAPKQAALLKTPCRDVWKAYFGKSWATDVSDLVQLTKHYRDRSSNLERLGASFLLSLEKSWNNFYMQFRSNWQSNLELLQEIDEISPNSLFKLENSEELVGAFSGLLTLLEEVPISSSLGAAELADLQSQVRLILHIAGSDTAITDQLVGPCARVLQRIAQALEDIDGPKKADLRTWLHRASVALQTAAAICQLGGLPVQQSLVVPTMHAGIGVSAVSNHTVAEIDLIMPKELAPGPIGELRATNES